MSDTPAEKPNNVLVNVLDAVIDHLIKNEGVEAAVLAAQVELPALKLPVIDKVFRWFVGLFAGVLDFRLKGFVAQIVIPAQAAIIKKEYDGQIQILKSQLEISQGQLTLTKGQLDALYQTVDRLVQRSR